MNLYIKFFVLLAWALSLAHLSKAQCTIWEGTDFMEDAKSAHVLYTDKMKAKDYEAAFPIWKKAFELAPAADGRRDAHFVDGTILLNHKYKNTQDETLKKELADQIIGLYDQAVACLESGAIKLSKTPTEKRIGFLRGRQAFDMFYNLRTPYSKVKKALDECIVKSGNDAEYIILDPYAHVMVNMFTNDKMDASEVRKIHQQLNQIVAYNIANNERFSTYYKQAQESMNATFATIERQVYDCNYFKDKYAPEVKKGKPNYERTKEMIITLRQQGCDSSDVFVSQLSDIYKVYVDSINAVRLDSFRKNNPAYIARELYEEGNYKEAIRKYEEAIDKQEDVNEKASYKLAIASIQFRKLRSYSSARSTAYEAAKLRSGWGDPYMLIADMYATSARDCGDSWNQRLAVLAAIDKYAYARSIDSGVSTEANKRIGRLSASKPSQEDGHMQGFKEGQSLTVGCWIGETVKLRYQ